MNKLVVINNIPTPYRSHLFSALHHEMQRRGMAIEVWFMAESEVGRYWKVDPSTWDFQGRIFAGIHPNLHGITMHLNPGMWFELMIHPPTWLLVGGGWQLPTIVGTQWLRRQKTYRLIWAEANYRSSKYHSSGLVAKYRRYALNSAHALVIPGQIAYETLTEYWQVQPRQLLYLPNLVDESVFRDEVNDLRKNRMQLRADREIPDNRRVLLWAARLNEDKKGICNYLEAIKELPVTVLLAGDGPDRPFIEQWAHAHPGFDLRMLGHITQDTILECMAIADVAVLPSFADPNPLIVIEAMWAGLPILTSVNCGNWPETVSPGTNGWLVDPSNPNDLYQATKNISSLDDLQLRQMGRESLKLAENNFGTRSRIATFIDNLVEHFPPRG